MLIANTPAQVVVAVGTKARFAFQNYLNLESPDHLLGPIKVGDKKRLLVVVPHPNSFGGQVPLSRHLKKDQMEGLRQAVVG
ncbi:MAG TPA: hypothetical protein VMV23_03340 [Candidatus Nanopelagicaceae bacterium]|nr:hypothetical protein [Candidatus Nanopelagicaceae bacterium]